jgi:methionine aminopeptidase
MLLAIEPIIGFSSWEIYDKGWWEIYVKNKSLWSQFEHTILITDWYPEIII